MEDWFQVPQGSVIKQVLFSVNTGDIITFGFNFLTNENTPDSTFNDKAIIVSLNGIVIQLADTFSPFIPSAGDFDQQTGDQYSSQNVAITTTSFTLCFVVLDVGNTVVDSGLLIDRGDVCPTVRPIRNGQVIGDPHYKGFGEIRFDVHGENGKYDNILQDECNGIITINQRFFWIKGKSSINETHIVVILEKMVKQQS